MGLDGIIIWLGSREFVPAAIFLPVLFSQFELGQILTFPRAVLRIYRFTDDASFVLGTVNIHCSDLVPESAKALLMDTGQNLGGDGVPNSIYDRFEALHLGGAVDKPKTKRKR